MHSMLVHIMQPNKINIKCFRNIRHMFVTYWDVCRIMQWINVERLPCVVVRSEITPNHFWFKYNLSNAMKYNLMNLTMIFSWPQALRRLFLLCKNIGIRSYCNAIILLCNRFISANELCKNPSDGEFNSRRDNFWNCLISMPYLI
jgi:hypothetical protein